MEPTLTCPECGSDHVRTYVHAMINFKSQEEIDAFNKTSILGRDVIDADSPAYHCDDCDTDFGKASDHAQ